MEIKYLKNVSTLRLNSEKCTGCGLCTEVCPHNVFRIENCKAAIRNIDACMECGACAKNCAFEAITLKPGVGCAAAIISGWFKGIEPVCGCGDTGSGCC